MVPNPSGVNQTATLTAKVSAVSPGVGSPTGSVQFFNGGVSLGMSTISAGVATLPVSTLALGANVITAQYLGDTDFVISTSTPVTANVLAATSTVVVADPNTAVTGQTVVLTATVTPVVAGGATPTGDVDFFNGSAKIGTATLDSTGVAHQNATFLAGTPSVTAVYKGDNTTYAGSTSPAITPSITKADTSTAVNVVPSPSNAGASVMLTATITANPPGGGMPTGSVTFFNGTTPLGNPVPLANGIATLTSMALMPGANSITAQYAGDTNYNGSTSGAFTQNVLPATTTVVASSLNPSVIGQPITFTAGVSSVAGTPDGTVEFFNGTTSLGTATLSNGLASISTSSLPFAFSNITATYRGNASFSPSTSISITQTVNQGTSTTTVTGSPNPAGMGQTVTFTATVTPNPPSTGGPVPTGSVVFMDGTMSLGTVTLANGSATFTTSTLSIGSHSITAVYNNDANSGYTGGTSAVFTQVISVSSPSVLLNISFGNPVSTQNVVLTASVGRDQPCHGHAQRHGQLLHEHHHDRGILAHPVARLGNAFKRNGYLQHLDPDPR